MPAANLPPSQPLSSTVAILEWICGGGLLSTPVEKISSSLLDEGQAMLLTLIDGLAAAGIKVHVPLDRRLFSQQTLAHIASQAQIISVDQLHSADCLVTWCHLAEECEWTWLVAPELDDTLAQVASRLRSTGARLLNASAEFLQAASDKLYTAQLLHAAGIPHPLTRSLERIDDAWLRQTTPVPAAQPGEWATLAPRWVVKPADGAGSEGLRIVDRRELELLKQKLSPVHAGGVESSPSRWIVQPWLNGIAASCSAIVDPRGLAHWLPVVSQDFAPLENQAPPKALSPADSQLAGRSHGADSSVSQLESPTLAAPQSLAYLGCTYPSGISQPAPDKLLNETLRSLPGTPLGWIGIDLLFDPLANLWSVIEINPRCTSSLVGLSAAYGANLVHEIYRLQTGALAELTSQFSPTTFRVNR